MKQLERRQERSGTVEELMGVEGMAARTYFTGLSKLVDPRSPSRGEAASRPGCFNSC